LPLLFPGIVLLPRGNRVFRYLYFMMILRNLLSVLHDYCHVELQDM